MTCFPMVAPSGRSIRLHDVSFSGQYRTGLYRYAILAYCKGFEYFAGRLEPYLEAVN